MERNLGDEKKVMHKMSATERRQRIMRRIHTLQSEDTGYSNEADSRRSSTASVKDEASAPPSASINPNLLFVPDIRSLGLDRGEVPPHKRVRICRPLPSPPPPFFFFLFTFRNKVSEGSDSFYENPQNFIASFPSKGICEKVKRKSKKQEFPS